MKILDIAIKDLTRSFRSLFAVIFMFGVPLLVTGMFYLMFGGMANNDTGFNLPQTKVVVANLDEGGAGFQMDITSLPQGTSAESLGNLIVSVLQGEGLTDLMVVTLADSAEAARQAVDSQEAGVAVIIPADFSQTFSALEGQAVLEVYQDPTLTLGPAIIRSVLDQFMDGISGAKITVNSVLAHSQSSDPALIGQAVQQYMAVSAQAQSPDALVTSHAPDAAKQETSLLEQIIGPIMGGMMIFYAFFTGTSTAQTILKEDEEGTLPRLFTTPTSQSAILSGKFLAVFLTVLVQMVVLLILGRLIFQIAWGSLLPLALVTAGIIFAASSCGIFINSLLKSTKQGGVVFGAVLTMTGMLGMIKIFTMGMATGAALEIVPLFVPQGWAIRGLVQSMQGAPIGDVLLTSVALLAWSAAFFILGVWRFQKRYA